MQYHSNHVLANMHAELPNIASYYHHYHQPQFQQHLLQSHVDRYSTWGRLQDYQSARGESSLDQLITSSSSYGDVTLTTSSSNVIGSSSTSSSFQPFTAVDQPQAVQQQLRHAAAPEASELATGSRSSSLSSASRYLHPAADALVNALEGQGSRYRACYADTPRKDAPPHCNVKSEQHRRTDADNDVSDNKDVHEKKVVSASDASTSTSTSTQLQV